jgi:Conjugative transposon protein TcpC
MAGAPLSGRRPQALLTTHSLRRVRLSSQITRHLVHAAAIAGLIASARFAIFPPAVPRAPMLAGVRADPAAAGFAELFARRYLTWDSRHPDQHGASLAPLVGATADPDAGLRIPVAGEQHVSWASVVQERGGSAGERVYTVAAQTDTAGLLYMSVAVARRSDGRLALSRYPSFVGSPAVDSARPDATGAPVQDPALAAVVQRALGNYLAGSAANLAADLLPGARVADPTLPLSLQRVLDLRWSPGGGAVQAAVDAQDARGADFTLSYELDVGLAQDRWEISAIQMDPTA